MNASFLAAIAVVSLAALATVVAGREPEGTDGATPEALPVDELDLKRIARERRESSIQDVFNTSVPAAPSAPPAPQAAPVAAEKPEPPPAPSAPPLPFTYLGRMTKGERTIVYLLKNQELVLAEAGRTLEADYRVEDVSDSAVQFVYLPLGTRQVLNVPPRN